LVSNKTLTHVDLTSSLLFQKILANHS